MSGMAAVRARRENMRVTRIVDGVADHLGD